MVTAASQFTADRLRELTQQAIFNRIELVLTPILDHIENAALDGKRDAIVEVPSSLPHVMSFLESRGFVVHQVLLNDPTRKLKVSW